MGKDVFVWIGKKKSQVFNRTQNIKIITRALVINVLSISEVAMLGKGWENLSKGFN